MQNSGVHFKKLQQILPVDHDHLRFLSGSDIYW